MADADEDPDLAPSTAPPGLHVAEQPFSLAFHPANELLAVGLIDGTIEFHAFRSEREATGGKPSLRFAPSAESRAACRALEFAPSGERWNVRTLNKTCKHCATHRRSSRRGRLGRRLARS